MLDNRGIAVRFPPRTWDFFPLRPSLGLAQLPLQCETWIFTLGPGGGEEGGGKTDEACSCHHLTLKCKDDWSCVISSPFIHGVQWGDLFKVVFVFFFVMDNYFFCFAIRFL